ncbi:COX15/CtaA family protein [Methylophaga sp. OBS1]|uniref:COX15/CtaA family protein n=1 Tax=Methylophaga sp. OBS1 TaxID=2991933 RepID=UPI00224FC323|nr:COX15/CtaA family protein [Methylophaga sp. OBS1]MCX4193461.1 COX15/CtaA family protein [Methylophaga sp. OBS1]
MSLKSLANLAFALAFIVVTLGALTRLLDAGLGCPDWPGCYGQLLPPAEHEKHLFSGLDTGKAWMEMIHRYAAGLLGLIILLIMIRVERDPGASPRSLWLSRGLLALVIAQALFGMWTVTMKLQPQIVTIHLLGGMILLALLWRLRKQFYPLDRVTIPATLKNLVSTVIILTFFQISLGGWTSSQYAGLACTDFPTCQGQWLPAAPLKEAFNLTAFIDQSHEGGLLSAAARQSIQVVHRFFAMILTLCLISLCIALWRYTMLRMQICLLLFLTTLQIALGIANALLMLPLTLALAHNTGAALLMLCLLDLHQRLKPAASGIAHRRTSVSQTTG